MKNKTYVRLGLSSLALLTSLSAHAQQVVPGYVPPVTLTTTPNYADDTRGIFVPSHQQHRMKTDGELGNYSNYGDNAPLFAQAQGYQNDGYERELNRISNGHMGYESEINRIASDASPMRAPTPMPHAGQGAQGGEMGYGMPSSGMPHAGTMQPMGQSAPMAGMPSGAAQAYAPSSNGGVEIAVGEVQRRSLDMANSLVRLREDRISIRRALQRMMDQIGGGEWTIVWDLAEQNAALPEMEISLYAEEPFMNVLNALLARVQTRSGQPLRVIRYDNTQRMVITDRAGGHRLAGKTSPVGVGDEEVAVTENVLKEAMVSIHYDEIPLVDALENIVNQAGKGEWRLRVYAGLDQVLKPAHVEEPFEIAMERLLKLFNLKYEVFPGGKLIVVTHNNRFGFRGVQ